MCLYRLHAWGSWAALHQLDHSMASIAGAGVSGRLERCASGKARFFGFGAREALACQASWGSPTDQIGATNPPWRNPCTSGQGVRRAEPTLKEAEYALLHEDAILLAAWRVALIWEGQQLVSLLCIDERLRKAHGGKVSANSVA